MTMQMSDRRGFESSVKEKDHQTKDLKAYEALCLRAV